jgi:hypothetical protein
LGQPVDFTGCHRALCTDTVEPVGDVGDDVIWVFDADRQWVEGGRDAGDRLLFRIELAMRRRAWMDCKAARVADVG